MIFTLYVGTIIITLSPYIINIKVIFFLKHYRENGFALALESTEKQWKIFQDNVSKFSVKSLSQTHWESRIESVKAIKFQASKVRDALT